MLECTCWYAVVRFRATSRICLLEDKFVEKVQNLLLYCLYCTLLLYLYCCIPLFIFWSCERQLSLSIAPEDASQENSGFRELARILRSASKQLLEDRVVRSSILGR